MTDATAVSITAAGGSRGIFVIQPEDGAGAQGEPPAARPVNGAHAMNAVMLLNSDAGPDRDALTPGALRDAFRTAGCQVAVQRVAPGAIAATVRSLVAQRPEALIVGGGDGTVSTAAGLLADTGIPLGIVPLGTLNHFARDLGMPIEWREAVPALAAAHPRKVDVAEVNGRIFVNNCSLGSYPEAVRRRERLREQHGRGKWAAMLLASITVFRRLRRMRVRIEMPGTTLSLRTPFVIIGNNRYSGHLFDHSLRPRLDECRLWIYTTRVRGRLPLLRLAWQSFVRSIDAADALEAHAVERASVTSANGQPLPIALDGELVDFAPPLHFQAKPAALVVLAPPPKPERP